jgi:hypothetical protein
MTILLQKPAELASTFSMAEPVAVMMRRGEEEDEEGAVATTSSIFYVARNRDQETAHVFAFQELFARTLCKLQKGNFVLFCSVCLSLATLSFLLPYPSRGAQKASSRQSEEPKKRHTNKVRFRDYYCYCRPVSIYFHLLLLLLPPVL